MSITDIKQIVYDQSPFLPLFDHQIILDRCFYDISLGIKEAPAIAAHINQLFPLHLLLMRFSPEILKGHEVGDTELEILSLGYQYPLAAIQLAGIMHKTPRENWFNAFEQTMGTTLNFNILIFQGELRKNLVGVTNLLKIDPSGFQVFDYLKRYSYNNAPCFLAGMEIAAATYSAIAQEVVSHTGSDAWLMSLPPDPSNLG